jgi:hypothetical protein
MSHVSPCLVCPDASRLAPVWATADLGSTCMRGRERDESVRDMVDLRAETSSLSDKIEFTETQGQSALHHLGTNQN